MIVVILIFAIIKVFELYLMCSLIEWAKTIKIYKAGVNNAIYKKMIEEAINDSAEKLYEN